MGKDKKYKKNKKIEKNMGAVIIVVIILFFAFGPILLQPYNSGGWRRAAKDWPTTKATIMKIYPEGGISFKRRYKFSYSVNGNNYGNLEIAERYTSIFSRKPDGTVVEVHYDPQFPSRIVVVQEDANVIYNRTKDFIFIGGGIVVLFGILVVVKKK